MSSKEDLVAENYGTGKTIANVLGVGIQQFDDGGTVITREFFEEIIREVLQGYQHFPYINTESDVATYTSITPTSAGVELTLMCDSVLYLNAKTSGELMAYSQASVPLTGAVDTWTLSVFNTLTDAFVDVYTTDITGFWDRNTVYQGTEGSSTIIYLRPLTATTTDCKIFYLQAGTRIKLTQKKNKASISGIVKIVPIKKYNQITTKKFIPDCTITLNPSSYSMNYDNYSSDPLIPAVTVVDPNGNTLVEGTDYVVSYVDNVMSKYIVRGETGPDLNPYLKWSNTNQGSVVITGIGNWGSSTTKPFNKKFTDNKSRVIFASYVSGGDPGSTKSSALVFLDSNVVSITWEGGDRSGFTDTLSDGSGVGNTYTSAGKKYYKKTFSDGTTERTYLEL